MRWLHAARQRVRHLATSPGEELTRGARFVHLQARLWYFCLRRLRENNALAMSAALSFRTIFAMVPAIVLVVVALKGFGLEQGKAALRGFLAESGLAEIRIPVRLTDANAPPGAPRAASLPASAPASAPARAGAEGRSINVAEEIEKLVNLVEEKITFGRLGPIGMALLIWTALTLMTTMEKSLNRIFGAPRPRTLGRRILLFWSCLTLGPLAFILADVAGGEIVSFFEGKGGFGWALVVVGWVQPVAIGIVLLTGLYALMPNTRVSLRAALAGAAVAFPLWLIVKWAFFSLYVAKVVRGEPLYGSLGLLPLFLMWLNISWLLLLFGAELAHTAGDVGRLAFRDQAERLFMGPWELLAAALAVAGRYAAGGGAASLSQVAQKLNLPSAVARELLERLTEHGTISPVAGSREAAYVPSRPADKISVAEVLALAGSHKGGKAAIRFHSELAHAVQHVRQTAHDALAPTTLADLLEQMPSP